MHPHQFVNTTTFARLKLDFPKGCALVNPAATFGQFISRPNPGKSVLLVMVKLPFLDLGVPSIVFLPP